MSASNQSLANHPTKQSFTQGLKNARKSVTQILQRLKDNSLSKRLKLMSIGSLLSQSQNDSQMLTNLTSHGSSRNTLKTAHVESENSTIDNSKHEKSNLAFKSLSEDLKQAKSPKVGFSIVTITKHSQTKPPSMESLETNIYEDIKMSAKQLVKNKNSDYTQRGPTVSEATIVKPNSNPHFAQPTIAAKLKQKQRRKYFGMNKNISRRTHKQQRTVLASTDDDIILRPFKSVHSKSTTVKSTSITDSKYSKTFKLQLAKQHNQVKTKITQFPEINSEKADDAEDSNSILDMDLQLEDLDDLMSSKTIDSRTIGTALLQGKPDIKPKKYIYPKYNLPTFSTGLPSNERITIGQLMRKKNKGRF